MCELWRERSSVSCACGAWRVEVFSKPCVLVGNCYLTVKSKGKAYGSAPPASGLCPGYGPTAPGFVGIRQAATYGIQPYGLRCTIRYRTASLSNQPDETRLHSLVRGSVRGSLCGESPLGTPLGAPIGKPRGTPLDRPSGPPTSARPGTGTGEGTSRVTCGAPGPAILPLALFYP